MTHELYKTKEEIESWLNQYRIELYELIEDEKYGYIVNVNKSVYLNEENLYYIKVKFNKINGHFNCSENNLTTLKGCPKEIIGVFDCSNNQLVTLEGCPEKVGLNFYCLNNKLKTLEYCSEIIMGEFDCSYNQLKTLEYFPEKVNGNIKLHKNNELKEIQNINNFEELKKIHEAIVLNKKLEKEINIDNAIKNDKIKL